LAALESVDDDETLLYSLFQIFLDIEPGLMDEMKHAITMEDRQSFLHHVHQLKGALFAVQAHHQAQMVERLETESSACSFPRIQYLVGEMEHEVEVLTTVFKKTLQEIRSQ
jgi:HPt (histidine-containing phosphotransfer) domain-containing protein